MERLYLCQSHAPGPVTNRQVISRRGHRQRWPHGAKQAAPASRTRHDSSGLVGLHRLANCALLAFFLISTILCVLELQMRLKVSRTSAALQEARAMEQLFMDSRAQLMAASDRVDHSTGQDPEPLLLPPPPNRPSKPLAPLETWGGWFKAGVLRGY